MQSATEWREYGCRISVEIFTGVLDALEGGFLGFFSAGW